MANPYNVGDVLYSMWGYEQTNVDFYEVVRVTPCTVRVVSIGSATDEVMSSMSKSVVPNRTTRGNTEYTARLPRGGGSHLNAPKGFGSMSKWEGAPVFSSSWG